MQLKKLTMQAFGPFKDKVEIDFEKAKIDRGLLLITGDTGAGKTTIFDAICYALYGESSGTTRKTNSLRSDFSSPDTETYVKLEFYHNNKEYSVRRSPEYMRKSKRGNGETKQPATAEFEINGRMETKTNVVTKEIESLIGLDFKQFRQVAMLSQGEFTKFLLASSDEKTSIFRKIFNTDIYSNITLKLKEDLVLKEQKYKRTKEEIEKEKNKITDFDFSNLTNDQLSKYLEEKIISDEKALEEKKKVVDKLNEKITTKKVELEKIEETNRKIKELENSKEKLQLLQKNNVMIEKEKGILDYNLHKAPKISNLLNLINKEQNNLKDTTKSLNTSKEKLTALKLLYDKNKEIYADLDKYGDRVTDINKKIVSTKEKLKNLIKFKELNNSLIINEAKLKEILDEETLEHNKYNQLSRNYYLNEAFILAETLEDNMPCPVCGSYDHPHKALKNDYSITKEDLEKQNEILSKIIDTRKTHESKIDSLKQNIKELNLDSYTDVDTTIDELNTLLDSLNNKLKEIKDSYNKLLKEKTDLTTDISKGEREIELYNDTILKSNADIERYNKDLNDLYIELNTSYDDFEQKKITQSELNTLSTKIKAYDTECNKYMTTIELYTKEVGTKEIINIDDKVEELNKNISSCELLNSEYNDFYAVLKKEKEVANNIKVYIGNLKREEKEYLTVKLLSDTANAKLIRKQRITFENYVQSYYLNNVLVEANKRLIKMTDGRYDLRKKEVSSSLTEKMGLEFSIFDSYTGKEREVSSLSGGEKFKAALALALGLSDVISMFAGGIKMDALFIDEGFGSLDQESLNQALNTLSDLVDDDKLVGIISHVSELISRIDKKIVVKKNNNGSYIQIES